MGYFRLFLALITPEKKLKIHVVTLLKNSNKQKKGCFG